MSLSRVGTFIAHEFRAALPAMLFFFVGFNLVELTVQLVMSEYLARLANFMVATMMALIVGKAVLVANALPFMKWLDDATMIATVVYKAAVYWAVVFVARLLEALVGYWVGGHAKLFGFPQYVLEHFAWGRFAMIQIWIFVLFLLFTFCVELDARLGEGGLRRMLFGPPPDRGPQQQRAAHH